MRFSNGTAASLLAATAILVDSRVNLVEKEVATTDTGVLSHRTPLHDDHTTGSIRGRRDDSTSMLTTSPPNFIHGSTSSRMLQQGTLCTQGYVDCVNGFVNGSGNTIPCVTACGGSCCVGIQVCGGFTGKVCKDGSCSGNYACRGAKIPLVVNSCKNLMACPNAGNFGAIGNMINSCNAPLGCYRFGMYGVAAGNLQDSCNGHMSCYHTASYGGSIGSITSSCNGVQSCRRAGKGLAMAISSNLRNCCNLYIECIDKKEVSLPSVCKVRGTGCIFLF